MRGSEPVLGLLVDVRAGNAHLQCGLQGRGPDEPTRHRTGTGSGTTNRWRRFRGYASVSPAAQVRIDLYHQRKWSGWAARPSSFQGSVREYRRDRTSESDGVRRMMDGVERCPLREPICFLCLCLMGLDRPCVAGERCRAEIRRL